jgi:hypothetical protein
MSINQPPPDTLLSEEHPLTSNVPLDLHGAVTYETDYASQGSWTSSRPTIP